MAVSKLNGRGRLGLMFGALLAANLLAWLWAWTLFADRPALLGTALLAWVFGLRHAVDADHIAAIDNVVRKLMQEGRRPIGVGFWFSLGHSTIVILACVGIAATASALDLQQIKLVGETIGSAVSAAFLLIIALANMAILRGVWRSFRQVQLGGTLAPEATDLLGGGPLARLFRPLFGVVRRSWQMYPLGFLFGLGFDTATEVGLLAIAATQSAQGLGPWQVMVFPALFTAGMALVDTADSTLMVGAYGWAFLNPLRKLWYNLTMTAASIAVALLIGGIEGLGLLADRFQLDGTVWSTIAALNDDLADMGFAVVGIFALAWGISAAIYRWRGYDVAPVVVSPR